MALPNVLAILETRRVQVQPIAERELAARDAVKAARAEAWKNTPRQTQGTSVYGGMKKEGLR